MVVKTVPREVDLASSVVSSPTPGTVRSTEPSRRWKRTAPSGRVCMTEVESGPQTYSAGPFSSGAGATRAVREATSTIAKPLLCGSLDRPSKTVSRTLVPLSSQWG